MGIPFHSSPAPTIGMEVEVQVIDPETRNLTQRASELLDVLDDPRHFKPEFIRSNLEINTDICRDVALARDHLTTLCRRLLAACDDLGLAVACAGTHPFAHWKDQQITPEPRYRDLARRMAWTSRRLVIFGIHYGIHYHIGVPHPEQAIAVLNALMTYIPHLLAVSASSPFWMGQDTGLQSTRAKIFETLPTAGLPYVMTNWNEFVWFMETLIAAQAIQSIREIWWDIRPHPRYGTLEIRICDGIPRVEDILAVAALVQALVVDLGERYRAGERLVVLPGWIIQENKWCAARYGLTAHVIRDRSGALIDLGEDYRLLLDRLEPLAERLHSISEWPRLRAMAQAPGPAERMRAWYRTNGRFNDVVDHLIAEFRASANA